MNPEAQTHLPERATALFRESQSAIHRRTDQLFANLMLVQWLAGIAPHSRPGGTANDPDPQTPPVSTDV